MAIGNPNHDISGKFTTGKLSRASKLRKALQHFNKQHIRSLGGSGSKPIATHIARKIVAKRLRIARNSYKFRGLARKLMKLYKKDMGG